MRLTYSYNPRDKQPRHLLQGEHYLACEGPHFQYQDEYGRLSMALAGHISNLHELSKQLIPGRVQENYFLAFQELGRLYRRWPLKEFCNLLHGSFFLILFDHQSEICHAITDPLGDHFFFHGQHEKSVLISNDLQAFSNDQFPADPAWAERYFAGEFRLDHLTPRQNVTKSAAGECLLWKKEKSESLLYCDAKAELKAVFYSRPDGQWQNIVSDCKALLQSSLESIRYFSKDPYLLLSQGVDSVCEVVLASQQQLKFKTLCKIYEDSDTQENQKMLANLLQSLPSLQTPHLVSVYNRQIEELLDSSWHFTPTASYWSSRVIDAVVVVDQIKKMGGDMIVSGHGGDEAFLHRYRYRLALELDQVLQGEKRQRVLDLLTKYHLHPNEWEEVELIIGQVFPTYYSKECYSINPRELHKSMLKELCLDSHFDPVEFITHSYPSFAGNSYDREHSIGARIPCFSPYRDLRLLKLVYSLNHQELIKLTENPLVQDQLIKDMTSTTVYGNKSFNFVPSSKVFPMSRKKIRRDFYQALAALTSMGVTSASYYQEKWGQDSELTVNRETVRVLSYHYWQKISEIQRSEIAPPMSPL